MAAKDKYYCTHHILTITYLYAQLSTGLVATRYSHGVLSYSIFLYASSDGSVETVHLLVACVKRITDVCTGTIIAYSASE